MARNEFDGGRLFDLYARYVGEPESRRDVLGYWTFIVGYVVGFAGVVGFLLTTSGDLLLREAALALAAVGLPLGLLGIVLTLPVRRRGLQVSTLGAGVALVAVAWFLVAYPGNWGVGTPDYSPAIIALYSVGIAAVGGVAALVPVLTGERSLFFEVEHELDGDHPEVMVGRATEGALFSVYRQGTGAEWTWRLLEQGALAESADEYLSRLETEESVDRLKRMVAEAGLLEIKHAAFRLYEAEGGWRWLLMRGDGGVAADSGHAFEGRDEAADSVSYLKEHGPDAPVLSIEGAAFDLVREAGEWRWRLVDEDRTALAESASGFETREDAEAAIPRVASAAKDADDVSVEHYGVELLEDGDGWGFRVFDAADATVARNASSYGSRGDAESAVYEVLEALPGAAMVDAGEPAYEVYGDGEFRFRLVDPDEGTIVRSHEGANTAEAADADARRLKEEAADADVIRIEDADFEYYRSGDGWRWRLVTADREVIAESNRTYGDREAASAGVEAAKTQALSADLIEFEEAAFQLYEHDGNWRWRLIDEDGNVMADSGDEHETKDGAAASMTTLKEHAPDADLIEIETAAFEFFQNGAGEWNWRLVDETGHTTTQGSSYHETKAGAREAMDRLVERAEGAAVRAMERSAFQVYADEEEWRFRFVRPDGRVVADGEEGYSTRDAAETAIEDLREVATGAPVHTVGTLAVQVVPENGGVRFRLVDGEREPVVEGAETFAERDTVEATVDDLRRHAPDAAVFERRGPTFEVVQDDGWRFRLVAEDRSRLLASAGTFEDRASAAAAMNRVRRLAPSADLLDFEDAAFEVSEDADGWSWRLIDEDERVIAAGAETYDDEAAVREAVAEITGEVSEASIVEIDTAAFELHEDAGEWRWRLIAEDGNEVASSLRPYDSRAEAREAMEFVKEHAGDAATSVAE